MAIIYAVRVRNSLKRGEEIAGERLFVGKDLVLDKRRAFFLSVVVVVIVRSYSTPSAVVYPG